MWYVLPDTSKQYPLTIDRVKKIKALNAGGTIPAELEAVEITSSKPKEIEPEFVDVVGHITLKSLEKADKKRHQPRQNERPQRSQQQRQQQQKGNNQQQRGPAPQQRQQPPSIQKQNPENRFKPQPRPQAKPPQRRPPNPPQKNNDPK